MKSSNTQGQKKENPTLIINRSDSVCGNCGKGADPYEKTHKTVLSYSEEERKKPGCGIEWKYMVSDYSGLNIKEASIKMRPDLIWQDNKFRTF